MHPPKNNRVKRIVNGGVADYGEWPWYVQLQKKRKSRLPFVASNIANWYFKTYECIYPDYKTVILKWMGRREGGQQLPPSLYHSIMILVMIPVKVHALK